MPLSSRLKISTCGFAEFAAFAEVREHARTHICSKLDPHKRRVGVCYVDHPGLFTLAAREASHRPSSKPLARAVIWNNAQLLKADMFTRQVSLFAFWFNLEVLKGPRCPGPGR